MFYIRHNHEGAITEIVNVANDLATGRDTTDVIGITSDVGVKLIQQMLLSSMATQGVIPTYSLYYEQGKVVLKPNMVSLKINRSKLLSSQCADACASGTTSTALGEEYFYPTQAQDQQNLAAIVTASHRTGIPSDWSVVTWCCKPDQDDTWALREHTAQQIQEVGESVLRHIETQRKRLRDLASQVNAISTEPTEANVAALEAIQW